MSPNYKVFLVNSPKLRVYLFLFFSFLILLFFLQFSWFAFWYNPLSNILPGICDKRKFFFLESYWAHYIERVFLNRWAVLMGTIFCISDSEWFPGIFLCIYQYFFFVVLVLVVRGAVFHSISISMSLYFECLSNSFTEII